MRWDAKLDRGRELRGRLVDPRDVALAHWLVEIDHDGLDLAHTDCAVTDERGEFRITNLPQGAFRLLARPSVGSATLPVFVAPVVWPSIETQEFVVLLGLDYSAGSIRVDVRDERGEPLTENEVRVWKYDVARGTWARRVGGESIAQAEGLLPGEYSLEIGAPGRAWLAIDHVFVSAGETIDLGRVSLAAPGRFELVGTPREEKSKARLSFRRRGAVESISSEFRPFSNGTFELPAGEYELVIAGDAPRVEALTVAAGETVQVELAPR